MSDWREKLLERIQADFPLTPAPYAALADEYGVTEGEIIEAIGEYKGKGIIRRIGATLDSRKIGYASTLVACRIEPRALEEVAAEVGKHPGVTHSYEREGEYNFWFTLIAKDEDRLNAALDKYAGLPGVIELHSLPAEKVYKIRVRFPSADEK